MSRQAETVIRGIIRDVLQRTTEKVMTVSQQLAGNLIKAVVLDPAQGFSASRELQASDISTIVQRVVDIVLSGAVTVSLMRLQANFTSDFVTPRAVRASRESDLQQVVGDVEDEILSARVSTREDLEALYKSLVTAVLLRSRLGSPTDIAVVKETTAALESVLPPEDLGTFLSLPRHDKRVQLHELASIAAGIRLFSRHAGKGGRGIPDVPTSLTAKVETLLDTLVSAHAKWGPLAARLTAAVLDAAADGDTKGVLPALQQYLALTRQVLYFLQILMGEAAEAAGEAGTRLQQLKMRSERVTATVEARAAVPTDQIFPQFVELAGVWADLQHDEAAAQSLQQVADAVAAGAADLDVLPDNVTAALEGIDIPPSVTEAEARQQWNMVRVAGVARASLHSAPPPDATPAPPPSETHVRLGDIKAAVNGVELLTESATHGYDNLPLELAGFCPHALVTAGAIVPANRHLGIVKHGNQMYGFNSRDGLLAFTANPEGVSAAALAYARSHPGWLDLLRLHNAVARLGSVAQTDAGMRSTLAVKCDAGMQTELHPVESHIDPKYEWNEWELRRQALKLADIRSKKTHSTQTNLSHYRRENTTQVYLPKTRPAQTRKDGYTNTAKPVTYTRGLRGARGAKATPVQTVDLTLRAGGIAMAPKTQPPPFGARRPPHQLKPL